MPQTRGKTVKKSRSKSRKQTKVLTIPEVRSSLKYISDYASSMVRSGKATGKAAVKEFAAEWKRVFGKVISFKAAENYMKTMTKMQKKGRSTRKMRGGADLLSGAPVMHMTRPGVDLPYGNFAPYVSKGFVNPEPGILQDCGKQTGILPQAGMGSNQVMKGGGLFSDLGTSLSAAMYRPFVGENPSTNQHNLMTSWKGLPPPPGPESWQKTWQPHMNPYSPASIPTVLLYNRDLTQDIRNP